jgi:hypothetical protein
VVVERERAVLGYVWTETYGRLVVVGQVGPTDEPFLYLDAVVKDEEHAFLLVEDGVDVSASEDVEGRLGIDDHVEEHPTP